MTIDHDALRIKYREERDKRLRPDGNDQYLEPTGRFASMLDDPYTERIERAPRFDEVTVALIGGGFSGLCVGARLKQAGIDDVRIIEVGGDFGGAWYWNRYPGAMCDTAAIGAPHHVVGAPKASRRGNPSAVPNASTFTTFTASA